MNSKNTLAGLSKIGNLYIPRKHFYIKYLGKYELSPDEFPVKVKHLAFCYHENEDITYCIFAAEECITTIKLWRHLVPILQARFYPEWKDQNLENEYTCCCIEIELSSHWESIFHHHIGLKANPEICNQPGIQWKTPPPYKDLTKYRNKILSSSTRYSNNKSIQIKVEST